MRSFGHNLLYLLAIYLPLLTVLYPVTIKNISILVVIIISGSQATRVGHPACPIASMFVGTQTLLRKLGNLV